MFCAEELHSELLSMIEYLGLKDKIEPPLVGKIR
ncbi:MAG: enoyl-CoA hydratase/isomerase family protein, partial [Bacillota bacterium]|jgi:hypothetical protein|nr:enoyl-CoA hydratase/isomerase family protein [Bacillota bacterium]